MTCNSSQYISLMRRSTSTNVKSTTSSVFFRPHFEHHRYVAITQLGPPSIMTFGPHKRWLRQPITGYQCHSHGSKSTGSTSVLLKIRASCVNITAVWLCVCCVLAQLQATHSTTCQNYRCITLQLLERMIQVLHFNFCGIPTEFVNAWCGAICVDPAAWVWVLPQLHFEFY